MGEHQEDGLETKRLPVPVVVRENWSMPVDRGMACLGRSGIEPATGA
jgi:hypothetical protein